MASNINCSQIPPRGIGGGLVRHVVAVALILFTIMQIAYGLVALSWYFPEQSGGDLLYRRNEICCARQGVNSFRIWNRETTLPGFAPLERPDKPDAPKTAGDAVVHAYPPWHTAMFYWYGCIPERLCLTIMSIVFGLCLWFIVGECVKLSRARFGDDGLIPGFALAMISFFAFHCFCALNYGVLILAAFLLMNKALDGKSAWHDLAAGLAWSVMMIKPQVGLLFFWPLFWRRRYRVITAAVGVCLAATFVTSLVVHESMLDLILQIPEIGKPYSRTPYADVQMTRYLVDLVAKPLAGEWASLVVMGAAFVLTGFLTGLLRRSRDILLLCLPVVLMIPFWSYSHTHDHVILLPLFILLAGRMFTAKRFDKWVALGCFYVATILFTRLWTFAFVAHLFDPSGRGWIYHGVELGSELALFAVLFFAIREERAQPALGAC